MTPTVESIVNDYMRRLDQESSGLPPEVAKDVASQVREHIADALSAIPDPSESDVKRILAEVGSPQSIAGAAAAEFPSTHRVSTRTLSRWGYALLFGGILGEATFGHTITNSDGSTEQGLVFVWVAIILAGWAFIWLVYRRIEDKRVRTRTGLNDIAVVVASQVILAVLPSSIGMVRGLVLLALFVAYAPARRAFNDWPDKPLRRRGPVH